jgi:hypothetical protein
MTEIVFMDVPFYNRDFDADYPPVARQLKDAIAGVGTATSVRTSRPRAFDRLEGKFVPCFE